MHRSAYCGPILACLIAALAPRVASAQELRYSTIAAGRIIGTGNTLGLAKELNLNGPGIEDSIGTFISLTSSVDDMPADTANPWPTGTTYDWTMNGSTAVLTLPIEAQVLYAELVWGGSYNYGGEDVTASLDTPVTLTVGSASSAVSPDSKTSLTIAQTATKGFAVNYYMRSADVTAFVKASGSGTYSASGVPGTQSQTINTLNATGWTLAVVVRDSKEPVRNLSVFVGGSFVDENSQQDYTVSGFCTPPAGVVHGLATISAIEGDASLTGDQLLIAPTSAGPFAGLSGPNNPANNFFASQINDGTGNLDTQGSFGTANHDAMNGVNVSGGRQGWDVTTVPLTSDAGQLENAQTSAVLRTITTGDSYVPVLAALAIDVNAPDFTGSGSTFKTSTNAVTVGDKLTVTMTLENSGQVPAEEVLLTLPIDPGLSLSSVTTDGVSGDAKGAAVTGASLATGVNEGDLAAGKTRTVVLVFDVIGKPSGTEFLVSAKWGYSFQVCAGGATLPEAFTQFGSVTFNAPTTSVTSGAGGANTTSSSSMSASSSSSAGSSSGGAGGSGGSAPGSADFGSGDESAGSTGGCGCSVPKDAELPWRDTALVLAAAGLFISRRRARRFSA